MKNVLYFIGSVAGVIVGFWAIWKLVIPFIGHIFLWFAGIL